MDNEKELLDGPDAGATAGRPSARDREAAERRLHALEAATTDVVSGEPIPIILERIAGLAAVAVQAAGHLLAVSLPDGTRHVSCQGAGTALIAALGTGTALEDAHPSLTGVGFITVPVATADQSYGVLAVVAHPGDAFVSEDINTLKACASQAAVSLDIARLLARMQEQGRTAQLLLDVARSLNERSTVDAVSQSVADAIPALCGADRSAVALWDADAGQLRIGAMMGWKGALAEKLAGYITTASESPELAEMLARTVPLLIDRNGSEWAKRTLEEFGLQAFAATPITNDGKLVGIVIAHWADQPAPPNVEEVMFERLTGLAGIAGVALDNIQLLEETRRQVLHDPLTGLPNRAALEDLLETALVRAAWTESRVAVLFCGVNRLERINDSLGHGVGDQVLQQVALRLRGSVRHGDSMVRYSGGEFAFLLQDLQAATEAELLAEVDCIAARIRLVLSEPFEVHGKRLFIDAAIGTALSDDPPRVTPDGLLQEVKELVERAEHAMFACRTRTGEQALGKTESLYRLRLENDLRGAAGRGELRVHFQPQIDLRTNRIIAAEALVRWQHPELGLIPPAEFISLAEESPLIDDIGAYVLAEACRTGAAWHALGHPVEMCVNISAAQFTTGSFAELVSQTLHCSGFPAASLILEITESQLISDSADVSSLWELKKLGVCISIDDFGTGYSSLKHLHRLPVSEIKIDKSFTDTLEAGEPNAFVTGIIALARGLGLRVVAEGVETFQQLAILKALECERAQGFLFGEPTEARQLQEMLNGRLRFHEAQEAPIEETADASGALRKC